jgi:hypothetical protein
MGHHVYALLLCFIFRATAYGLIFFLVYFRILVYVRPRCELLANERSAVEELQATGLAHGGAGLAQYAPSTGKGSIANDFFHREEVPLCRAFRFSLDDRG